MSLSLANIAAKLRALGYDDISEYQGQLYLWVPVNTDVADDRESHDVVWDAYCDGVEELRQAGLELDVTTEHDGFGGTVREIEQDPLVPEALP